MTVKAKYMVCPVCQGEGKTVNPNIDACGLTATDFDDDPDFAQEYLAGKYDVQCRACHGLRVITSQRKRELHDNAEDRRLAAMENGDWESYSIASDYRFG